MTLVIWTSADARQISKVVGPIVAQAGVAHRVEDFKKQLPAYEAGDVVLAMGGDCLDFLKAQGLVPKNLKLGSTREKPLGIGGAKFLMTYNPGLAERDYPRLPEIQCDVKLAIRLLNTGSTLPLLGEYRYVDHFSDIIDKVEAAYALTGKPVEAAVDLETLGLDEYDPAAWIVSISITIEDGKSDMMYFPKGHMPMQVIAPTTPWESMTDAQKIWQQIEWLLTTEKISVRGANFKYDSRWLVQKWGIYCTNHKFDTLLVGSLLDENRSNSLKLHAKLFTDMGGYDDGMHAYDKGRMDLVPKPVLLAYAGGDTDATLKVAKYFKREILKDKHLTNFYVKLMHPASKVFEKVERNGLLIDVEYMSKLEVEVRLERTRLANIMLECVPRKLRIKHKDKILSQLEDEKSPFLPKFLHEFLFTPAGLNLKPKLLTAGGKDGLGEKKPSTAVNHLLMFDDDPIAQQFVAAFKEYNSASKTLQSFIVGFMKHLKPDNRFHCDYLLARSELEGSSDEGEGTVTGRTSAKAPAVQTIPKRTKWTKPLRKAYIARPGHVLLQLDFSQGELRIVACEAGDPTMLNAYSKGLDLHAITAAKLTGYEMADFLLLPEDVIDSLRGRGKAGNFGLIYGMQATGFQSYAFNSYGVKLTAEEALDSRMAFFDLYDRLPEWHETAVGAAHKYGYVRSPIGRIRHLPLIHSKDWSVKSMAERQAINSPIQSCLSDMMQLAMVLIDREYGHEPIYMCLMCHDSLMLEVPEDDVVEWAKRIKHIMQNLPLHEFGWTPQLTFYADAEYGKNMAELKKMKNL